MHILNFGKSQQIFPITFAEINEGGSKKSSLFKRRRYQMFLLKQLWQWWKRQYLLNLRSAHAVKISNSQTEFGVGDIVLIERNAAVAVSYILDKYNFLQSFLRI